MTIMLRQDGTGHIFHHTALLAQRGDMKAYVPDDQPHESPIKNELPPQDEGQDWMLLTSKAELAKFARANGVELDERKSITNMRADFLAAAQALTDKAG